MKKMQILWLIVIAVNMGIVMFRSNDVYILFISALLGWTNVLLAVLTDGEAFK